MCRPTVTSTFIATIGPPSPDQVYMELESKEPNRTEQYSAKNLSQFFGAISRHFYMCMCRPDPIYAYILYYLDVVRHTTIHKIMHELYTKLYTKHKHNINIVWHLMFFVIV